MRVPVLPLQGGSLLPEMAVHSPTAAHMLLYVPTRQARCLLYIFRVHIDTPGKPSPCMIAVIAEDQYPGKKEG